MNTIAAGLRADIDDRRADAGGGGVKDFIGAGDADAHGVDQNIAVIAFVEIYLAANRRHADAITIAANARHHAGNQMAGLRVVGLAEAQRIQICYRSRAHGEHIAHNAADAGRGPLIRLDKRWVIMAFHFEHCRIAVANIDDTGVFARPLDDLRAIDRQFFQPFAGRFIRAMLRPHDREYAEFGIIRRPPHMVANHLIFVRRQPVFSDNLVGDLRVVNMALTFTHDSASTMPVNMRLPSSPPRAASARRSGCGIMPTMRPALSEMPAMSR